ncbi:MAG TPA: penicillin acylase family protein, partial [bacterium]|nr:penicillin acylase family protein [bacterium]
MKIWVRRTLFGLTALLLVLTGLVLFGYFAARKSLPQTEGQLSLRGLSAPVTVYRDEFAVPHIDASGETDLMRATGYVQAQDRLWQMDLLRRIAEGRLSERFGTKTLSVDKALRTIGFMRMATMLKDSLPPDVMALLQAYADGVNAFIEENKGNYPPEFTLIDFTPEAWKPEHSIALSRLLGWQLSMGWHVDVTYDRILDTVGFAKLQEILPRFPADAPTIVPMVPPDYNAKSVLNGISENTYHEEHFRPAPKAAAAELRHFADALYEVKRIIGIEGFSVGSNNWVVSG